MSAGETLTDICHENGMPDRATVLRWQDKRDEFRAAYARAREAQAHALFDRVLAASREALGLGAAGVQAKRLEVDALKWAASKLAPRDYGDKMELSGDPDRPLSPGVILSPPLNPPPK